MRSFSQINLKDFKFLSLLKMLIIFYQQLFTDCCKIFDSSVKNNKVDKSIMKNSMEVVQSFLFMKKIGL